MDYIGNGERAIFKGMPKMVVGFYRPCEGCNRLFPSVGVNSSSSASIFCQNLS